MLKSRSFHAATIRLLPRVARVRDFDHSDSITPPPMKADSALKRKNDKPLRDLSFLHKEVFDL
jgi:hypothetical protein